MSDTGEKVYGFGVFTLDTGERRLLRNGQAVTVPPKVFDTLAMLVENAGRVVSKERLMNAIWDDAFVEENNLAQNISHLRRVVGRSSIETVPKFGYRFALPVETAKNGDVPTEVNERTSARIDVSGENGSQAEIARHATARPRHRPETSYTRNGDVNIAYQVVGDGPVDIVFVMGWVSHLEYFWEEPHFAFFLARLASFSRLILFGKRGTGLSDRVPLTELPTLEQRMHDVPAVMDAVGSRKAVLVGVSEGGPMCSLFAATYPERTAALVMVGTYAKRIRDDDYPWAPTEEQRNAFFEIMQREWGGPAGIEERAPSLASDQHFRSWWATYLRMGASPGAAVALTRMNAEIDVRPILPSVQVPTLVIHRSGDLCLKVEEGRFVAEQIPGAKFVELDGIDHLPFVGDSDKILDRIEEFVGQLSYVDTYDRVLATVLSVETNETDLARRQIRLFRGHDFGSGNGAVLATFDGPARAIRCAVAISRLLPGKFGLHTGECDASGDSYTGVAVELAQNISRLSEGGSVLVSRTVKDLVAGSGLEFKELGLRTFDGIEGRWRLFTVEPG